MNYYEILQVAPTATAAEIREAYIALCKDLHPDKLGDVNENVRKLAQEQLKLVNQAYETLKDEQLRANYDRDLANQATGVEVKSTPSEPTLDELLSSAILDEGFQIFVQEEDALWHNFVAELQRLREYHVIWESTQRSVNLFPDDLGVKFSRIGSLIFFRDYRDGIGNDYFWNNRRCDCFCDWIFYQCISLPIGSSGGVVVFLYFLAAFSHYLFFCGSFSDIYG